MVALLKFELSELDKMIAQRRLGEGFNPLRAQFLDRAQKYRQHHAEKIRSRHQAGATGTDIVARLTALTDAMVARVFEFACCDKGVYPCAIIALGGYGREEMNPYSDVDLMFYVTDFSRDALGELSERILYLLWDLSYSVGHCMRTRDECLEIAAVDLSAYTAMLDARFICGAPDLYDEFSGSVMKPLLHRNTRTFFKAKLEENAQRLQRYGSSVYILEPNIKEGEGGLRDLHLALWISKITYKVKNLRGLLMKGVISERRYNEFVQSLDYLWRIRNELHYLSGRKNDQLHFDKQEKIAGFLGYKADKSGLAVEQFMQDYYAAASRVEHITSSIVAAAEESLRPQLRHARHLQRRNIDHFFFVLRGELYTFRNDLFEADPTQIMRAFWLCQRHEVKLSLALKSMIRENQQRINDRMRRSSKMAGVFLDILRYKKHVYGILEQMHHLLFLNYFIPEFKRIYCRVQHDAYHIYTVDMHTLFAVKEITRLWQGEYEESKPLLTRLAHDVDKPELLILAVLLHDIGKGQGGRHAEKGAKMVSTIARRLRLTKEGSQRLQFIVAHHLEMAHISQRRDINDENQVKQFANTMQMSENLNILYLLTFADIKAVGPNAWTEWKGFLLQELYQKTYAQLERGNFEQEIRSEKIRDRKRAVIKLLQDEYPEKRVRESLRFFSTRHLMAHYSEELADQVRVILGRGSKPLSMQVRFDPELNLSEVIIVTLDVPGLFTTIAGVMAGNGINILEAQIYTLRNGMAVDILQVDSGSHGPYGKNSLNEGQSGLDDDWDAIEQDLLKYLQGRDDLSVLVRQRREALRFSELKVTPGVPPLVSINNEVSADYTVIDITTKDKVGLLYAINSTLNRLGLYIGVAKITTQGNQAGDTFYVQDIFGEKVLHEEKLFELQQALLEQLQ
ncbi:MAG: [protein-PII] uridylyltransferase [Desulfuromonadaceae bacterium]|nr:[protein-PII] uridylyltransferase [Desulfuromonadaceae bacterium]